MRRWALPALVLAALLAAAWWAIQPLREVSTSGREIAESAQSPHPLEAMLAASQPRSASVEMPHIAEPVSAETNESTAPGDAAWHSRVYGRVSDDRGAPIAEAVLRLVRPEEIDGETLRAVLTDYRGLYEIRDPHRVLSDGRSPEWGIPARLVAEAPGRARGVKWVLLRRGETEEQKIDFALAASGALAGQVVWESGEPVPGAVVVAHTPTRMQSASQQQGAFSRTTADTRGRFHLTELAPGRATVAAAPLGGTFIVGGEFTVGDEDVTVTLSRATGTVTGRVVGALSDTPYPHEPVWLGESDVAGPGVWGPHAFATETDEQGFFQFEEVPFAEWTVRPPRLFPRGYYAAISPGRPSTSVTLCVPEPATVAGDVVEADTQDPVPGLGLKISSHLDANTETDSTGHFLAENVPISAMVTNGRRWIPLTFTLRDSPCRFVDGRTYAQISAETLAELTSIHLTVQRGVPLAISAQDPDGTPIAGAQLFVAGSGRFDHIPLGETDASGHLDAVRPAQMAPCQVLGTHPDWPILISPVLAEEDHSTVVEALPTTSLEVTVVDAQDHPLPDMTVLVTPSPSVMGQRLSGWPPGPSPVQRTDAAGRTVWPRVARCLCVAGAMEPDRHEAYETRIEHTGVTQQIDLTDAEEPAHVTLHFETFALAGRVVVSGTDQGIEGARVFWLRDERASTVTDADGAFTLPGREDWQFQGIGVTADGYQPERLFRNTRQGMTIPLHPEIVLRGRVQAAGGAAPPQASLLLFRPAANHWGAGWETVGTHSSGLGVTGADGAFEWRPAPFTVETSPSPAWLLAVTRSGQSSTADFMLDASHGQSLDLGTLTLRPGITLSGRVLNPAQSPVSGATVEWEHTVPAHLALLQPPPVWSAETDAQGQFTLHPLPEGHWRICVTKPGLQPQAFEVDLHGDLQRDLILAGEPMEVVFHVRDEHGAPLQGAEVMISVYRGGSPVRGVTGADGDVRLGCSVPGQGWWQISCQRGPNHIQLERIRGEIPAGGLEETVDLSTWVELSGLIRRGGAPAAHVGVQIRSSAQRRGPDYVESRSLTDEEGSFTLRALPGQYLLIAEEGHSQEIELTGSQQIEIELSQPTPSAPMQP